MRRLSFILILTLLLSCTPQIPEEEVMCTVTFELIYPEGITLTSTNMVLSYTNANTLEQQTKSSITTPTFTHVLRQGYYHLMVEGFAVTSEGTRIKLRAVIEHFSALDPTLTYSIRLQKIGS